MMTIVSEYKCRCGVKEVVVWDGKKFELYDWACLMARATMANHRFECQREKVSYEYFGK